MTSPTCHSTSLSRKSSCHDHATPKSPSKCTRRCGSRTAGTRHAHGMAWHGIARLLLSCDTWRNGWQPFHDRVVYRESNEFRVGASGPNAVMRRAETLTGFLAEELGIPHADLCNEIAVYWRHRKIAGLQPHNLLGHAFRSLTVHILETFGDQDITYAEEVSPHDEFPGPQFTTRSRDPKIDIVARRGGVTVALISSRWRFRHDRVDVVEEALATHPPPADTIPIVGSMPASASFLPTASTRY